MTTSAERSARKLKYGTNVIIGTIAFVALLVAANFLASRMQWRLDLTRSKQFTVSDATKQLLRSLKDIVTVNVYATKQDTPPDWTEQREQLIGLLREYRRYSGGRVHYTVKDPSNDDKAKQEAQSAGIREQPMQKQSSTEISVKVGYLGMIIQYRGKTETIPVLRPESSLEYQLTRAINKAAEVNIPTVAVVAPAANPYMARGSNYDIVPKYLEGEGYTVKQLDLSGRLNELKPDAVKLAMIFDPEEFSEEALYNLDQYIMGGGKVFVAASGIKIDQRSGRAEPKVSNINSLLETYGLRVNQDVIEDWGRGLVQRFMTPRGYMASRNPFIIDVADLSEKSKITRSMQHLLFLFASSISKSARGTSGTIEVLGRTSDKSKKQETVFNLQQEKLTPPSENEKLFSYDVVMSVKGDLDSRYFYVDPPAITNDDGTTRTVKSSEIIRRSTKDAQVIVAGTALSFLDEIIQGGDGQINALFLLNVADELTRGGELISLRSKQVENARLDEKKVTKDAVWWQAFAIAAVPILLILFGILKVYLNRMKRARYREIYGPAEA